MIESNSDNEAPFLPKEHDSTMPARRDYRSSPSTRWLIVTVALTSAFISAVGTIIMHNLLPIPSINLDSSSSSSSSSSRTPLRHEEQLPSLNLPPLGNLERPYLGGSGFYDQSINASHKAWMELFPPGMGYVSMDKIKEAGEIPQFYQGMSTDGSGRFCVAAFHQLHCLYLLYEDFRRAKDGQLSSPGGDHKAFGQHSFHCFDYLRESIICAADSSLEPFRSKFDAGGTQGNGVDGFGAVHQCRDFQQLYDWSEKFRYSDGHDASKFEG